MFLSLLLFPQRLLHVQGNLTPNCCWLNSTRPVRLGLQPAQFPALNYKQGQLLCNRAESPTPCSACEQGREWERSRRQGGSKAWNCSVSFVGFRCGVDSYVCVCVWACACVYLDTQGTKLCQVWWVIAVFFATWLRRHQVIGRVKTATNLGQIVLAWTRCCVLTWLPHPGCRAEMKTWHNAQLTPFNWRGECK